MNIVGSYIRELMDEQGLDQMDLALQCHMPYQNVSAVLLGKRALSLLQSILMDDVLKLERGTIHKMQQEQEFKRYQDIVLPSLAKYDILVKVKENGGLWSYSGIPNSFSDDDIIEEGLRHLDFEDMYMLFDLWSFSHIKRVWKQRLVSEGKRSYILNTLLGMMFFRIDHKEIDGYLLRYGRVKK